jgi:hypothetical protein
METEMSDDRVNLNDYVWVRLTELGWAAFDNHHQAVGLDPAPYRSHLGDHPDTPEGWQRFQLWELMQIFGPHIHISSRPLFDDNDVKFQPPQHVASGSHTTPRERRERGAS